ncbi:MAG TPA: tetratricopeptide repeat protein, partial [Anaerolineales bacterium]|nr:tetratricopeptide repeat protein [Anaerolineales bacterium]
MAEVKRYHNERWNFSITYPDDWEIVGENEPIPPWVVAVAVTSRGRAADRAGVIVNVRRGEVLAKHLEVSIGPDGTAVQAPTTPQEFIQVQKEGNARYFLNYRFHAGEETRLLGKPAVRTVYSYDGESGRRKEQCITMFGVGVTFQFICEAPAAGFDRWQPTFDHVIGSFRIGKGEDVVLPTEAPAEEMRPIECYNAGVALYREGQYEKAKEFFRRCYESGEYRMQAAYAEALCDRQLGRRPTIPEELKGREDETGVVYVASNLACYLIAEGHRATLTKTGEEAEVSVHIQDAHYTVRTSSHPIFGSFEHFVSRVEEAESVLIYPVAQSPLTETDRYLISLVEHASSLPLSPMPEEGLRIGEEPVPQPAAAPPTPSPPPEPQQVREPPRERPRPRSPTSLQRIPERWKAPPTKGIPRHPPTVLLLNLTGLGLGYLYMRLWLRWLIHFLPTVGWVVVGFLTNAVYWPLPWLVVWVLWLLWMAFDGWWQSRKLARTAREGVIGRRWLSLAVAVLLLAAAGAGVWGYLILGQREFVAGAVAYRLGDCRTAMQHFNRVTTLYELTLGSYVADADAGTVECSLLVYAENARGRGEYAEAVAGYETYLGRHPAGPLVTSTYETVAEVYGEWAAQLREEGEYEAAIEKYQIVSGSYPDTPTGAQAAAMTAETYVEWAARLVEEGEYQAAIEKYEDVFAEYPDTPAGEQAPALAAATYSQWAAALRDAGDNQQTLNTYERLLVTYPDTEEAADALSLLGETALALGQEMHDAEAYEEEIVLYERLLGEYPEAFSRQRDAAQDALFRAYMGRGAQLHNAGAYEEGIRLYTHLTHSYPGIFSAHRIEVREAQFHAYFDWGEALRDAKAYEEAIAAFEHALSYVDLDPSPWLPDASGHTERPAVSLGVAADMALSFYSAPDLSA